MGITYKEVKSVQDKNISVYYNFYRKFSTPFTYIFAKLGFSPSGVSILNFFPPLVGYFFLSKGTYATIIIGLLFFVLYKILDCSDGELARIQSPKAMDPKHKRMEGPYFDAVGHFIEPIFFGAGLGMGFSHLYGSEIYITFGILLAVILSLEFALNELLKSYLRKGLIERKIRTGKSLNELQNKLSKTMDNGLSFSSQNILTKIFGIYPFQGLFYSKEFLSIILLFVALVEYYFNFMFVIYGISLGALSLYLVLVASVKLIKTAIFIVKLKNRSYISEFLRRLQKN